MEPAILAVCAVILAVLVPLGAAAAGRGYRRMDGSPLPQPYQRGTFFSIVVFLGCLVILTLALGLAPGTGGWLLFVLGTALIIVASTLIVVAYRRTRRAANALGPGADLKRH